MTLGKITDADVVINSQYSESDPSDILFRILDHLVEVKCRGGGLCCLSTG